MTGQPEPLVAYFSMEVGLRPEIPTYAGGLGVLAGDTLRAASDLGLPLLGVSLVHRMGYFRQQLDGQGNQTERPSPWEPGTHLEEFPQRARVDIQGRTLSIRAWRATITGSTGTVPLYLLDTDLPENQPEDRHITDYLYGGDTAYRLVQEAVLGLGGVAMLRTLGHDRIQTYHMNEGHSALLAASLLEEAVAARGADVASEEDLDRVRRQCVFTTHTPVPAGLDQFPMTLAREVLGARRAELLESTGCCLDGVLNMTYLAMHLSHYLNGVAMRHRLVSRSMFPGYPISSITNGVHAATWVSEPFQEVFDRHIPEWRRQNLNLRYAVGISLDEIRRAHERAKLDLLAEVERRTGVRLDPGTLTIGFARRATLYKRADLFLSDPERLRLIDRETGPIQIIYAGKAHPRDEAGKALIRRVNEVAAGLRDAVPVVYLEEYDMALAKYLCSGVDLWLNTPQRPQEASGTSGMKAALNGVPSLSVLDGWWIEGHVEGVTGWSIGETWETEVSPTADVASLYDKLQGTIVPLFYARPDAFARVMRSAIALNGSFFNAERMVFQYAENAYGL